MIAASRSAPFRTLFIGCGAPAIAFLVYLFFGSCISTGRLGHTWRC